MKKMLLVLAVIAMTVPAVAGVVISGADQGDLSAVISYDASSMSELVRAFALNISVDNGAKITAVEVLNADYNIYPGSIQIDAQTGTVTDYGQAVADAAAYPNTDTLAGLNTDGVTVEMGSLEFVPAANDVLVKITVDKDCTVTVAENAPRAGIVMEDPTVDAAANLPLTFAIAGASVCKGDISGDGAVSAADMNLLLMHLYYNGGSAGNGWTATTMGDYANMDLSGDGALSAADMNLLLMFLYYNGGTAANGWTATGCYTD